MKHLFLLAVGLMLTALLTAQQQNQNTMKKYEKQLSASGRGNSHVAYQQRSIDQIIYEFMEAEGIPGLTLAIVQAPYIPRVAGYGITDIENKKLASAKTIWPVGPISQAFTAVAIMQLQEKGGLDLNDVISKYLKDLPDSWKNITIKQLLQHSSGIADYRDQKGFNPSNSYTPAQLLETVQSMALTFSSGTFVQLSATNFLLLTEIIEKVSKMSYHDFVWKNQIDYLGLKQTFFSEDFSKIKQESVATTGNRHKVFTYDRSYVNPSETTTGYKDVDEQLVNVPLLNSAALKGFADIYASAENISHWDIALAGSILIKNAENRDMIYKPTTLANGKVVPAMAGWQFYGHKGLMDIKGSVSGHSAFLSRFTDASELVCVTLLANKEGVDFTNVARQIAAAFDNEKLGTGSNEQSLYTYESQFSVNETMSNIEKTLKTMGIPVFAKFDHSKNAEEVGLKLLPNQVIVFGSPKVGTKLMQDNPSISIELPLRISVWEDEKGSVWATFPQMKSLSSEYGLEEEPIVGKMQEMLKKIVIKSAGVY